MSLPRILLVQKQKYLITIVCLCALVDLPMTVLVKISWMVKRENFAKKKEEAQVLDKCFLVDVCFVPAKTDRFF